MTHQIVVAVEGELSDHDASEATARGTADGPVDCHLLIATGATDDAHGSLAMLGVRPGETFGSAALARLMHVQPAAADDRTDPDLGRIMTRSADRLRSASGGQVTVTIARGDLLAGVLALAKATGSQEVVIVTDADSYPHRTMPEWQQKAAAYLKVPHVRVVEHLG